MTANPVSGRSRLRPAGFAGSAQQAVVNGATPAGGSGHAGWRNLGGLASEMAPARSIQVDLPPSRVADHDAVCTGTKTPDPREGEARLSGRLVQRGLARRGHGQQQLVVVAAGQTGGEPVRAGGAGGVG